MKELTADDLWKARHAGNLPTPEVRIAYAARVREPGHMAAEALLCVMEKLRTDPDSILGKAFRPKNILVGGKGRNIGTFTVECTEYEGETIVFVTGTTTLDAPDGRALGFRVACRVDGRITSAFDPSFP